MRRILQGLPWLLMLLIVAKSGNGQQVVSPDVNTGSPISSEQLDRTPVVATPPVVSYEDYILGPGDLLEIRVFQVEELNTTVRVGLTGTITLPLLGQFRAADLTPLELQFRIANRLAEKYVQDPQVTIFVQEYQNQPVSIIGAVEKPGVYQLTTRKTLIEMLSLAGGLAKNTQPAGRTVMITRPEGFGNLQPAEGLELLGPDKVAVNLRGLLYSPREELNIQIKPRDIITVSKADVIYVAGEVNRPGGYVLEDEEEVSVLQAIAMAQGLGRNPSKRSARIIRRLENGSPEEIPIDLKKVLKGKSPDVSLIANDILFVPRSGGKAALKQGADAVVRTLSGLIIWRSR